MEYEVWHVDTDELVGYQEIGNPINEEIGVRVPIRCKRPVYAKDGQKYNALEMLVCRMVRKDKTKYFALETNVPMKMLKNLQGFRPKVRMPSLMEIFSINRWSRTLH